jgi:dihydrolipoamide dehydrogenase
MKKIDVIILGAGSAGLKARRSAEAEGASTLLLDPSPRGTKCAAYGCMPSKVLIRAAQVAHTVRRAPDFGVDTQHQVSWPRVIERVRRLRDDFTANVQREYQELEERGVMRRVSARFTGPRRLETSDGDALEANAVVIATGASPAFPGLWGDLREHLLTSGDVFDRLDALPQRLLVVGAGPIGLELGQAMARLGVEVTILGKDGLLGQLQDPAVKRAARDALAREVTLHLDHTLHSARFNDQGQCQVEFTADGHTQAQRFDAVLVAAGQRPNLEGLGLEETDVQPDDQGRFDGYDPCSGQLAPGSWLFGAGDVIKNRPLLHEATDEGQIAGVNAARHPDTALRHRRRVPFSVVFTHPNLVSVGLGHGDLGPEHATGSVDYSDQGRARVEGEAAGQVRIYAERDSGTLVGAELCAPGAEHLGHLLAWSIQQKVCVRTALQQPFYHPTLEEGLRTALRELEVAMQHASEAPCGQLEYGPGC